MTIIERFTKALNTVSHTRAGWDYPEMSREQRMRELRDEKAALNEARTIWQDNPDNRDDLIEAFVKVSPLATLDEIQREPVQ